MSEAIIVSAKPSEYTFGIRFKPSILAQFLDINVSNLTDKKLLLKDISTELFKLLSFQEKDENKKVKRLNIIFENIFKNINFNSTVVKAVKYVNLNKGNIQIKDLEKELKLSSRQIERLFQNYIGYSPKKFCNIIRFFSLFKELIKSYKNNLSHKAYDYGYCDQAHLNKEFKKFSNFTPTDEIMSVFYNT